MNSKVLTTLEFNKIVQKLSDIAGSSAAKKMCADLQPMSDLSEVKKAQKETSDALSRIWKKGSVPFDGLVDIGEPLKRLEIGSVLGTGELLAIKSVLGVSNEVKTYGRDVKDKTGANEKSGSNNSDEEYTDSLTPLFEQIEPLTYLKAEIDKCILAEDEIADDASHNLKNIRRQMKIAADRVHTQLNSFVNSKTGKDVLQDTLITMRDGRYCVPVKAEHRAQVDGIVHDQSATGSTVFVEPKAVVDLNNKLRDLAAKEAEEIQIILANLSNSCAEHIDEIYTNVDVLTKLDFILAKGALAKQMKATMPILNDHGYINIKQGRHPLLDVEKVVPIDVYLGKDFTLLVVTGPNTGGKTVSLKTVGLLTLMGQAGLHIPADDRSEIAVFDEVFADIGDEQSIEQSLSTFSSHMVNTVDILKQADENSLVLFDEIGAGTDPVEGAALAISILSYLKDVGARIMATTHYSELKLYALSTKGVSNASCEFNVETLQPAYKLLIGLPGKSNAFAISSKLGLSEDIIEGAKERIDSDDEQFEDVLNKIDQQRVQIEKDQETIAVYKSQIEGLKKEYEQKRKRLEKQRDRIVTEAKEEAAKILKDAKTTADKAISDINKNKTAANTKEMEQARGSIGEMLKDVQTPSIKRSIGSNEHKPSDFKLGTGVKVLSLNLNGHVTSLPDKDGNMDVQMGILNSKINIKDLEIIDEPDIKAPGFKKGSGGKIKMQKSTDVSMEINLIGKTVDEAISALEKYLDDAYIAKLPQVTIIHGKGTGKLRSAIQSYLKKCKYVDSYRNGTFGEGGSGATIVTFK